MTTPYASYKSFVGIAKETTPGTPVAATDFIKITGAPTLTDNAGQLMDAGWRGAPVVNYGAVQGTKDGAYSFGGNVHPDTIGWCLAAVLGEVASTGASAPYSHAITVLNSGQPKSYTLTDFYGPTARQLAGAQGSQVEISFAASGLLAFTSQWTSHGSATATTPAASWSAVDPLAGRMGTVTIGGTPDATVLDGKLTIARPVDVIHTVNGSQDPTDLFSGPVTVTGSFTMVMKADTYYADYVAGTSLGAVVLDFTTGTGTSLVDLKATMSKCVITGTPAIQRDANYVKLAFDYEGLANATDIGASGGYSPIKVTLQNAVAAGTYA